MISSSFFIYNIFMQIIISPAKQMKPTEDDFGPLSQPAFLDRSKKLVNNIQNLDYAFLKKALLCSDKIARSAYDNYQTFDFARNVSPALFTYSGIQYQYMAPDVFTDDQIQYVQDRLWILSALYGALRPMDGIVPYRLEMQTRIPDSLYSFWSDALANHIPAGPILNLASEEYAKCIRKYRPVIDVRFCHNVNGKLKEKGVYAKMARGRMVRFMAEQHVETIEELYSFHDFNYTYSPHDSNNSVLIYIKK